MPTLDHLLRRPLLGQRLIYVQHHVGKIVEYRIGTDFNREHLPQLQQAVLGPAASMLKGAAREDILTAQEGAAQAAGNAVVVGSSFQADQRCGGLVVKGTRCQPTVPVTASGFSFEDDTAASGTVRVPLTTHLEGVAKLACRYTRHLPWEVAWDIRLAALCHDLGKADPRFQALLYGGNPWAKGPLLAKSGDMPQSGSPYERARRAAGYPQGGRHELLSVRLLESARDLLELANDRELVLHLDTAFRMVRSGGSAGRGLPAYALAMRRRCSSGKRA